MQINDKEFLSELQVAYMLLAQCQGKIDGALTNVRTVHQPTLKMLGEIDILKRMIRLIRAELLDINLEIEINLNDK